MKRKLFSSITALALTMSISGQAKNGPIVDKVIYDVRMDQTIAIKDTAEGKTDVFFTGLDAGTFFGIPKADLDKLSVYAVPSGSWSLLLNPIPNEAPYTFKAKDGKEIFNPLAIQEVRYALNWLIDRKKIVDEVLKGGGEPMFTAMTPGQPGTYRFNLIPAKLGMTSRGNEKRALDDIEKAMQAAANLPANKGKLVKSGQWWTYNGEPVTVKFMIRVDDPTGRLPMGRYVADQIEKAGIKVERLEYDRSKAGKLAYYSDPADWEWSMYTEGWGAGATRAWWDVSVSQMYAPYFGYMPGGQTEGFWNYKNDTIDQMAQKLYNGWFLTADEYWRDNLKVTEMALKEAIRIYIASQTQYYVANKNRFNSRMLYGMGDGLNNWSVRSADVKADNKGEKVLRITQYSARGGLFMSSWDPVGTDGFSDVYSAAIVEACTDPSTFEAPHNAKDTPLRVKYDLKKLETKIRAGKDGKPEGLIPVDPTAIMYNSRTKKWESGIVYKEVEPGKYDYVKETKPTTYSKLSDVEYIYGKWHSGQPVTIADIMYASAFVAEWANKDGENDPYYDEALAAQYQPAIATSKGIVLNRNGTFTSYYDFNWPMDLDRVAASGVVSPKAGNPGRQTLVSFEIYEALAKLVAEGSQSGTVYSFTSDEAVTEVDVINPKCVADIKAKLQDFVKARYVPDSIKQWITADQAVARYNAAIKFIDTYGHAYISNGPFFISKVDYNANYIELSAFRDYPYKSDYFPKLFATTMTRIDNIKVPASVKRTEDAKIDITVSEVAYPADTARAASNKVNVTLTLIKADNSETVYTARFVSNGNFQVTIPAKDLGALRPGSYTIVIQSVLANEAPAVQPANLVVF
ncbi:MAG TPA: ABC transporter substrate-binding protein [Termitinemataceae bacterium]|nr:ABC transporter substrate-binding protein [Termitinemataceae bacterium]HOM24220.1 ABC transporter substrate-binding protein [Termitinemataceae bacterium]HPQ01315.1 ABC transporter substrate-binding protein [Termitinemataceae bacterium]